MTSIRSSGLPHLAGLSGLTNLRLNRMDLPCSRCSLWLHAGGTNPGSTAGHSLCCAACNSAFPFERQGRLLRSRSISGLFSRSLYSGLQPPCLRFAVAVTGHHARLGTRLLARLYRGRHLRRRRSTHLQGATLIEPDVPFSGIRLSDWFHREAHGGAVRGRRSSPAEPLVSYRINRQFSGWNLPPLMIRAVGAHCHFQT